MGIDLSLYDQFMRLRRFPAGRAKQACASMKIALEGIAQRIDRADFDELMRRIEQGIAAADAVVTVRNARDMQTAARNEGRAAAADTWVDELVIAIHTNVTLAARRGRKLGQPIGDIAQRVLDTVMRHKLNILVTLPFEVELMEVEHIHQTLIEKYDMHFDALNIGALVEELGEALPVYRAALEPERRVTTAMVREAADELHLAMMELVTFVLGRLSGPALAEVRDRLLAGVVEQDERVREATVARRRAAAVDVDGDGIDDETGVAVDELDGVGEDEIEAVIDPFRAAEAAGGGAANGAGAAPGGNGAAPAGGAVNGAGGAGAAPGGNGAAPAGAGSGAAAAGGPAASASALVPVGGGGGARAENGQPAAVLV